MPTPVGAGKPTDCRPTIRTSLRPGTAPASGCPARRPADDARSRRSRTRRRGTRTGPRPLVGPTPPLRQPPRRPPPAAVDPPRWTAPGQASGPPSRHRPYVELRFWARAEVMRWDLNPERHRAAAPRRKDQGAPLAKITL